MSVRRGGIGLERAENKGQPDLHGIVKAARIEAGERGDLVEPVAQRVAVDRQKLSTG